MKLWPRTLFWKLFLGTTLLIMVVLCVCTWLILLKLDRFYEAELTRHLEGEAALVAQASRSKFSVDQAFELGLLAKEAGSRQGQEVRITMILEDGTVLADSEADPSEMESHATRKEVLQALVEGWGYDSHYSRTTGRYMKYVAFRMGTAKSPVGVVRVSMPLRTISERKEEIQDLAWTITLVGLIAATVFAFSLARLWSKPIRRITVIARSLSRGDLSARARAGSDDEMGLLARSLNTMREHLSRQLETIDQQRRTLESLLTQLQEGVVLAGPDGKMLLVNPAATRLLGTTASVSGTPDKLIGLTVEQFVSHHELQQMLLPKTAEDQGDVQEARIRLVAPDGERFLLAHVSNIVLPAGARKDSVPDAKDEEILGRLLVLTDITQMERTNRIKTDFASNASHELRTPLAAIRAAAETLLSMDLTEGDLPARQFLNVIERQTGRMEQMVVDLLDLSRIESQQTRFKPQELNLARLLEDMRTRYVDRLEAGRLQWSVDIPPEAHTIRVNPYLFRTVLDNLLDNAIKFTGAGGCVSVICQRKSGTATEGAEVSITVSDTGCGIPEEDQTRVFERFYQVEKARPGGAVGTGLGLSIVRHAVAAMNGTVRLESRQGEGTRVTVVLAQVGRSVRPASQTLS